MERVLPPEILLMIFQCSCFDYGIEYSHSAILNFRRNRNLFFGDTDTCGDYKRCNTLAHGTRSFQYETNLQPIPRLVSQVCRYWRNIAMKEKSLRTTDVDWIDGREYFGIKIRIGQSIKSLFKHLDANSPSQINVACEFRLVKESDTNDTIGNTFSDLLLPLLTKYAHRITALDVSLAHPSAFPMLLDTLDSQPLPRLRRLGLTSPRPTAELQLTQRQNIPAYSQSHVTTLFIDFQMAANGWGGIFGPRITVLKVLFSAVGGVQPTWLSFINELEQCERLQHLIIGLGGFQFPLDYRDYQQHPAINSPLLLSVTIKGRSSFERQPFWWLFFWVKTPSLEEIVVSQLGLHFTNSREWESQIPLLRELSLPLLKRFSAEEAGEAALHFIAHANPPNLEFVSISYRRVRPRWSETGYVKWHDHQHPAPRRHLVLDFIGWDSVRTSEALHATFLQSITDLRLIGNVMFRLSAELDGWVRESVLKVSRLTIADAAYNSYINAWLRILPALDTLILLYHRVTFDIVLTSLEDIQVGITPTLRKVVLGHLGNVYGEDTRPGKEFSQRLAKWINQMRAGGAPIFNITMSISPKSPALAELRSLVPDVEVLISKNLWDEHGESYCY